MELNVPKLKGVPFETAIIERYRRRESPVEEALIEMYTKVLISDNEMHPAKAALLKPYKERTPAFLILFLALTKRDETFGSSKEIDGGYRGNPYLYGFSYAELEPDQDQQHHRTAQS